MVMPVCVTLTEDRRRQFSRLLRAAIRRDATLQTMDCAAREAERDRRQFSRQIDGEEGSLGSLYRQPDTFWQWFAVEIVDVFGLPRELERAATLQALGRKKMARMAVAAAPKPDRRVS